MRFKAGDRVRLHSGCGYCGPGAVAPHRVSCEHCSWECKLHKNNRTGTIIDQVDEMFYRIEINEKGSYTIREDYIIKLPSRIEKVIEIYDIQER